MKCYKIYSMNTEYEAKFLNIKIEDIRGILKSNNAKLTMPMHLMRRAIIKNPELDSKNAFIRIREGESSVTLTYKQFEDKSVDGAKEIETKVESFEDTLKIFENAGLKYKSLQESKREIWEIGNTQIVIDQWPWLNTYIEIESDNSDDVQKISNLLGLKWEDAVFGSVDNAYRAQYPFLKEEQSIADLDLVRFSDQLPEMLKN